jgi:UDP-3-O-[3-hydroxymyristoyl] glucosamine N-acyltransferase
MMTLQEIAQAIGILCSENGEIRGLNTLKDAGEYELSFLESPKYIEDLKRTNARAVLIHPKNVEFLPSGTFGLITEEPYLKLALATKLFAKPPYEVGEPKSVAKSAKIMPNVYIGKDAVVGENVTLMSGAYVGDGVVIGDGSLIYPNVTVYRDCVIGKNCIIHASAVIGSDGFGFAHTKQGEHVKIYQNGVVIIEDDVEIGANTAIDRAVFGSTLVKAGAKIDNLVQIGHNCEIGERVIICGQAGLAGSSVLGTNVVMGAQSGSAGHLSIGDFATIAARGGVTKSIIGGKIYAGFPLIEHKEWLKQQATISRLFKKKQ